MTANQILKELKNYGNENTKRIFMNHGAPEPFYGVKVQDLKKIQKKIKKNHELALELYDTGNSDAMYLAGLIADESKMSKAQLKKWVKQATWYMISEYTVPWVSSETAFGFELGLEWIDSKQDKIASAGWATLSSYAMVHPDEELDKKTYKSLLKRVEKNIHSSPNRSRYTMNNFVIAIGGAIPDLTKEAQRVAAKIGKVDVDQGGTACKVPMATDYIQKIIDRGSVGKKRKTARC